MKLTATGDGVEYELREVTETDHAWLVELHNDPIVLHNLNDPSPITTEHHKKWWSSRNEAKDQRFIFVVNGERVGFTKFIQIDSVNRNCLLGADIHKDYRGKGHASMMWKLMLCYSFNGLNMWRVGLMTAEYNKIAQKVYHKVGFMVEGKLSQSLKRGEEYFDQITMYMIEPMYRSLHEQ